MNRVLLDRALRRAPLQCSAKLAGTQFTSAKWGWIALTIRKSSSMRAGTAMVCVTLDHDFHTHLALASAGSPSVVLIRVEGMSGFRQAELIQKVWEFCGAAIAEGAA